MLALGIRRIIGEPGRCSLRSSPEQHLRSVRFDRRPLITSRLFYSWPLSAFVLLEDRC